MSVIAKLELVIQQQQEQLILLRQIAASSVAATDVEEVTEELKNLEELVEFDEKLANADFKKKMVNSQLWYL